MGFKCGIVGLPNVGKSTLFNALTRSGVESANYPFCTIDPNIGMAAVTDSRLEQLADIVKPNKVLPATVEFADIAGLVKGASQGEGLGNQFLANIRETEVIIHVVRCFENDGIVHVCGKVSPLDDIEIINTELALADLARIEKIDQKIKKNAKSGQNDGLALRRLIEKIIPVLESGDSLRTLRLNTEESALIKTLGLLTAKPVLYVANVNDNGFSDNPHFNAVEAFAKTQGSEALAVCADIEAEISELNKHEKQVFLADMDLSESGLDRIIIAGYSLLGLQTYFTAGTKEVRAWTINIGDNAPQAAGKIHSDFEKGFIRAETIAFDDFIICGGEKNAKEAGKLRSEGKDYLVKDGDVINFLFNV